MGVNHKRLGTNITNCISSLSNQKLKQLRCSLKQMRFRVPRFKDYQTLANMVEELRKSGLYIDDIYRLRVQDPKIATDANELREECLEFSTKLQDFKRFSEDFHKICHDFSKDVEKERIRAISSQNLLKTIAKQRQAEQQIFQNQILEKSIELERLKSEYHYLQMIESDQQEIINNFVQNQ